MGLMSLLLAAALGAAAQVPPESNASQLRIWVDGTLGKVSGGNQDSAGAGTGSIQIGKTANVLLSMSADRYRCGFFARQSGDLEPNADLGWTARVTPTRVVGESVTFSIQWVRAIQAGRPVTGVGNETVVTLRPGEQLTLDSVVKPGAESCGLASATLVVRVDRQPSGWFDASLVETDLWLVEHLPNGKDDTQHQVVRGQMYQSVPFFFDVIQAKSKLVDFHGELVVRPGSGYLEVDVVPRRRTSDPGKPMKPVADYNSQALLRLKSTDVGSWEMPAISNASDPLAGRSFSLRIQTRQVR